MANTFAIFSNGALSGLHAKLSKGDQRTAAILLLAVFCAVMPLDISQLFLVLLGAVAYALMQPLEVPGARPSKKQLAAGAAPKQAAVLGSKYVPPARRQGASPGPGKAPADSAPAPAARALSARSPFNAKAAPRYTLQAQGGATSAAAPLVQQPSVQPVVAPTFKATGWDAQVDELVASLLPTAAGIQAVERMARRIQRTIRELVPEAEVVGFASGALHRGRAFGVAVPDVDVVVSCGAPVLAARLQLGRGPRGAAGTRMEGRQLQKSALRSFTDRLVATGAFKFRRSAFSAEEPKVTLLASDASGACDGFDMAPMDLAVNSPAPVHNAALLTDCDRLDSRARPLILLVRRWVRDRGICHAAKGHLSPYCWTLLAIYFLQVGTEGSEEKPVLPPLDSFKVSSSLNGKANAGKDVEAPAEAPAEAPLGSGASVGTLFKEFVRFYCTRFDFRDEAISVRVGRRGPPGLKLPLHIVVHEGGVTTEVGPSIEDPFDRTRNLGTGVTAPALARLRGEFARADAILSSAGAVSALSSLAQLLEPWVPEEWAAAGGGDDAAERVGEQAVATES